MIAICASKIFGWPATIGVDRPPSTPLVVVATEIPEVGDLHHYERRIA
jgi:hypothetical protein